MRPPARKEDLGQFGPCMQSLPNDKWRAFAYAYVTGAPGRGALVDALREAGIAADSPPANQGKIAWKLANDERMIAAIGELSRKILRVGAPEAANALLAVIRNADHKDHVRALGMVLDRADPIETRARVDVTVKVEDEDERALEELKAARALGATRLKLQELFGGNYLDRLEAMESSRAKVIDHEPVEAMPAHPDPPPAPPPPPPAPKKRAVPRVPLEPDTAPTSLAMARRSLTENSDVA